MRWFVPQARPSSLKRVLISKHVRNISYSLTICFIACLYPETGSRFREACSRENPNVSG
ncbi:hypothetical protein DO77_2703 [Brucella suis]|nr:hypothetical protein DO77_2703 [Brucella suis]KFJ33458.1 hypothetical protein DK66_2268 [Brucella suis 1330]